MLTSHPKLFRTAIIKTAVSEASVTSLYNRLFNALGSSRMRHTILPLKMRSKSLTCSKSTNTIRMSTCRTMKRTDCPMRQRQITLAFKTELQRAAVLSPEIIKATISLLPFILLSPGPRYLRCSLQEGPQRSPEPRPHPGSRRAGGRARRAGRAPTPAPPRRVRPRHAGGALSGRAHSHAHAPPGPAMFREAAAAQPRERRQGVPRRVLPHRPRPAGSSWPRRGSSGLLEGRRRAGRTRAGATNGLSLSGQRRRGPRLARPGGTRQGGQGASPTLLWRGGTGAAQN